MLLLVLYSNQSSHCGLRSFVDKEIEIMFFLYMCSSQGVSSYTSYHTLVASFCSKLSSRCICWAYTDPCLMYVISFTMLLVMIVYKYERNLRIVFYLIKLYQAGQVHLNICCFKVISVISCLSCNVMTQQLVSFV